MQTATRPNLGTETQRPSLADVERRAYEFYQAEGCVHGRAQEHWLRAERELMNNNGNGASATKAIVAAIAKPEPQAEPAKSKAAAATAPQTTTKKVKARPKAAR